MGFYVIGQYVFTYGKIKYIVDIYNLVPLSSVVWKCSL